MRHAKLIIAVIAALMLFAACTPEQVDRAVAAAQTAREAAEQSREFLVDLQGKEAELRAALAKASELNERIGNERTQSALDKVEAAYDQVTEQLPVALDRLEQAEAIASDAEAVAMAAKRGAGMWEIIGWAVGTAATVAVPAIGAIRAAKTRGDKLDAALGAAVQFGEGMKQRAAASSDDGTRRQADALLDNERTVQRSTGVRDAINEKRSALGLR